MNRQTEFDDVQLRDTRARQLDEELTSTITSQPVPSRPWQESGYRAATYIKTGLLIGGLAGCTSLLLNIIASALWPAITGQNQHALRLIQVYLTFPLGESALQLNSGVILALGCILYLVTGMLYGMLFEWTLSFFLPKIGLVGRLACFTVLALLVWLVNFYGILSWLQPLLFAGPSITELVPWWVAAATHLVFGWTMALIYPLGDIVARKSI